MACITVSSLSADSLCTTYTAAAKAAIGSTTPITPGSVSAVNSKKTQAGWPSPISRSNMRTALLIQKMDTRTSAKKPNKTMNCDSMYLSNLVTLFPHGSRLARQPSGIDCGGKLLTGLRRQAALGLGQPTERGALR